MINFKRKIKSATKFAYRFIKHEHQFDFKSNMVWFHEDGGYGYGEILECKHCGKELRIRKEGKREGGEQIYD